jgi:glycosyltransferase involved in cell wall biosynthesis
MPVKNGARFLPQALADIRAQTYDRREVIVVDGRSTDGSAEIARSADGVRFLEQAGEGFADAWNIGVRAARGELIAFLDSDDRWAPDKLAAQVEVLKRPEVDYVITRIRFFIEAGVPYPPGFQPRVLESDHVGNMPSALIVRRSAFERVGEFRTDLRIASDIEWFARAKDACLVLAVVPRVLVRKRVHDTNVSYFAAQTLNQELIGLLRETVARQRHKS